MKKTLEGIGVGIGIILILSKMATVAAGEPPKQNPKQKEEFRPLNMRDSLGHPNAHTHCITHTHTHEQGTDWHDRYLIMGRRWESFRIRNTKPNTTRFWGIAENSYLPPAGIRDPGKTHKHCITHTHSHINASHYHDYDGQWKSFRLD